MELPMWYECYWTQYLTKSSKSIFALWGIKTRANCRDNKGANSTSPCLFKWWFQELRLRGFSPLMTYGEKKVINSLPVIKESYLAHHASPLSWNIVGATFRGDTPISIRFLELIMMNLIISLVSFYVTFVEMRVKLYILAKTLPKSRIAPRLVWQSRPSGLQSSTVK